MSIKMKLRKGEISLDGYGSRAGFYGKCGVRNVAGTGVQILRSYDTEYYAAVYNGHLVIISDWYSAASARHLEAFAAFAHVAYHGKNGTGKSDKFNWHNLPRVPRNAYIFSDSTCAGAVMATVEALTANETRAA